jgi:hypothetical protein
MPDFHFEYDTANALLAARVTGSFTDATMKALYAGISDHVRQRDVRAAILDLTAASHFDVSAEGVRQMSSLTPILPDPIPKYIIAAQDHMFGMARMFQITSRGRDALRIVRSAQDVYDALHLPAAAHFERVDTH